MLRVFIVIECVPKIIEAIENVCKIGLLKILSVRSTYISTFYLLEIE